MSIRLDRAAHAPCAGHGVVCTGEARYVLVVASEEREQMALIGLCPWCVSSQARPLRAVLQDDGWNISAGLVDLSDDMAVRSMENELADWLDSGWVLGAMPSAS